MNADEYINLSIDQGDYENAAILALKAAQRLDTEEYPELHAQFALTLSNLALAQEYRKARR